MKSIKASEFKAKCLQLMNEVAVTGEAYVINKNGQALAEMGPVVSRPSSLAGAHKGTMEMVGGILAPLDEPWNAELTCCSIPTR